MTPVRIAILTFADDLHALAIQAHLRGVAETVCDVVETDRIADFAALTWSIGDRTYPVEIPTRDAGPMNPTDYQAIWYRRSNHPQAAAKELADPVAAEIVNAATQRALLGTLTNQFRGRWVSHPVSTQQAENKLVQLHAAHTVGLTVPTTLVSNDPAVIRRFWVDVDGKAVMKSVAGTMRSQLFTLALREEHLADTDALRLGPTIFQRFVDGSRHIRALCCGDHVYAAEIDSPELDWRVNLDVPVRSFDVDAVTARRLAAMLRLLGLRMGIFDLKLDPSGEPVFLELNPQGQFLFVEGLTGMDLTGEFGAFLRTEALAAAGN